MVSSSPTAKTELERKAIELGGSVVQNPGRLPHIVENCNFVSNLLILKAKIALLRTVCCHCY